MRTASSPYGAKTCLMMSGTAPAYVGSATEVEVVEVVVGTGSVVVVLGATEVDVVSTVVGG